MKKPPPKVDVADALKQGADPDALLEAAMAGGTMIVQAQAARARLAERAVQLVVDAIAAAKAATDQAGRLASVTALLEPAKISAIGQAWLLRRAELVARVEELASASRQRTAITRLEQLAREEAKKAEVALKKAETSKRAPPTPRGTPFDAVDTLRELAADAHLPLGLVVPPEYEIEGGWVWRVSVDEEGDVRREEVCRGVILPVGRLRDVDEGTEHIVLRWHSSGGWKSRAVRGDEAMVARALATLSRWGAPVDSNTAADVVRWLRAFLATNEATMPVAETAPRMGWRAQPGAQAPHHVEGFLWGATYLTGPRSIEANIAAVAPEAWGREEGALYLAVQQEGLAQVARGYSRRGNLRGWCEAVAPLVAHPRAYLGVLATFVPPLLRFMPQAPNFVIDWSARSSFGKTTTLLAAASAWGIPDIRSGGAIHSWGSSDTFIERVSATACDLPVILDDTRRARSNTVVKDVVMSVAQGLGRGRGTISGIQATTTWRTVLLSSGEESILDLVQVGGAAARTLAILDPPFPEESGETEQLIRRLESGLAAHHGVAGPALVQHLAMRPALCRDLEAAWNEKAEQLARVAPPGAFAQRAVKYLASLLVAYDLMEILELPRPGNPVPLLEVAWGSLRNSTEAADLEALALRVAFDAALQRQEAFWGRHLEDRDGSVRAPSGGWMGEWPGQDYWDHVAFFPTRLDEILRQARFVPGAILRGWARRGWIRTNNGNTAPVRLPRGAGVATARMVVVKREALVDLGLAEPWKSRVGDQLPLAPGAGGDEAEYR